MLLTENISSVAQIIATIKSNLYRQDEGRLSIVVTAKGDEVQTNFKVINASELIVSNSLDGRINPDYPEELQPRDRTRLASKQQVNNMANSLRPAQLADSGLSSHGAPIVGDDLVVESGNGRTMAIIKAYASGQGAGYKSFLIENAANYGLDPKRIQGMESPVLVRIRKTAVDRLKFTKDSNISDMQSMSAAEKATLDADRLNAAMVELFNPSEDGDLFAPSNMPFVREYVRQMGDTEAAGLLTANGEPTKQLIDRLQNAIFSKAYNDPELVRLAAEEPDPEIRNILKALNVAAADFMAMRLLSSETHERVTRDLGDGIGAIGNIGTEALESLTEAINVFREAKRSGQSIGEYVAQMGLFGDISEGAKSFALFIASNNRSAKRMGEAFKGLAKQINAELIKQETAIGDLFGDSPATLTDILVAATIIEEDNSGANDEFTRKLALLQNIPVDVGESELGLKFEAINQIDTVTELTGMAYIELKLGYAFAPNTSYQQSLSDNRLVAMAVTDPSQLKPIYLISDIHQNIDQILEFYAPKLQG